MRQEYPYSNAKVGQAYTLNIELSPKGKLINDVIVKIKKLKTTQ